MNVSNAVIYSRRGKTFEARLSGTRIAEADTRLEAEALLIEAVAPDLARRIDYVRRRCGDASAQRAHKGVKLLLRGAVKRNGRGWLVESETEAGKFYHVVVSGHFYCECIDFENGVAGQQYGAPWVEMHGHMCKHTWAVKLSMSRQTENEPAFVVKSRMIRNGAQQPDVIEGTFPNKGKAEAYADELARDIRDEWPAMLRRVNGHYKLVHGDSQTFVWAEELM